MLSLDGGTQLSILPHRDPQAQVSGPGMTRTQPPPPASNTRVSFSDLTGEQGDVHLVLCDVSRLSPWRPREQHGSKESAGRLTQFPDYQADPVLPKTELRLREAVLCTRGNEVCIDY